MPKVLESGVSVPGPCEELLLYKDGLDLRFKEFEENRRRIVRKILYENRR
jgi:hypothetical protein